MGAYHSSSLCRQSGLTETSLGNAPAMPLPAIAYLLVMSCLLATPAAAQVSDLCDAAAVAAARATDVPPEILLTLTRTETGRAVHGTLRPWPWAVNQAGTGRWLADRQTAVAHVEETIAGGASNIDIGCFQLNFRWHGHAFASIDAMFDPQRNALYAARFLSALHGETGDWRLAVGAFHSRRPEHAVPYLDRFDLVMADLPGGTEPRPGSQVTPGPRANGYPLLAGGDGSRGSLVPASGLRLVFLPATAGRPLFGP